MSYFDEFLDECLSPDGQAIVRGKGWHSWADMEATNQEEIEQLLSEEDAGMVLQQWLRHYGPEGEKPRLTVTAPYAVGDPAWCVWLTIAQDPGQTDLVPMQAPDLVLNYQVERVTVGQVTIATDKQGSTIEYQVHLYLGRKPRTTQSVKELYVTRQDAVDAMNKLKKG